MEQGLTMIYWGYGKGKSTAAIGMALRALGQGKRVLFLQFMKGGKEAGWETGEGKMFKELQNHRKGDTKSTEIGTLEFRVVGKGWVRILGDQKPIEDHEEAARDGLAFAQEQMVSGKWDVVVLDEILSAVDSVLLSVENIQDLIRAKPSETHLLMTGHNKYPELAGMADLVTNMEKVKHPYDKGVLAQRGVDF
ncbi:MAG: cob(I)yrinic acid a,c-diamide adenosyltransferase [bacterium]|nr:cob(I)yrinic acid a,c-diamide adenosyltransferase [bacterium]